MYNYYSYLKLQIVHIFTQHYKHVDDIDLFIGGVAEKPLPGALLGPTFTCIVGDQFARSKKADRFAYDLGGMSHSFSPGISLIFRNYDILLRFKFRISTI